MTGEKTTLTRRDAVAALAAAGVAGGGALVLSAGDGGDGDDGGSTDAETTTTDRSNDGPSDGSGDGPPYGPIEEDDLAVLVAVADVLYPSEIDGVEEFVMDFVRGRASAQPDHAAGVADAVEYLDEWTRSWLDDDFAALDADQRESALDRVGVRESDSDPAGSDTERLRYYVVNELLFALYASPTGGELVGIENPQGHPGGTESYRRGPE